MDQQQPVYNPPVYYGPALPPPVKVFSGRDVLAFILAFFLPPLAVFLERGILIDFWINILLTILGWIPGKY